MMKTAEQINVCIWVGSLKDYNEGRLVGKWISLPMDEDELNEFMAKITYNGEHDFEIMDYEAPFRIDPYASPWELNELAEKLQELVDEKNITPDDLEALLEYVDNIEEAIEMLENGAVNFYHLEDGFGDVWKELAEILVYDHGYMDDVPEHRRHYLNFEMIGRDLQYSGEWYIAKNGVAIEHIG